MSGVLKQEEFLWDVIETGQFCQQLPDGRIKTEKLTPEHLRTHWHSFISVMTTHEDILPLAISKNRKLGIIQVLLENVSEADLVKRNNHVKTVIHYLAKYSHDESICAAILSRCVAIEPGIINAKDDSGKSALEIAMRHENMTMISLLVGLHNLLLSTDDLQRNVLHYACLHKNSELVSAIMDKAPELLLKKDSQQKTPLDYVIEKGSQELYLVMSEKMAAHRGQQSNMSTRLTHYIHLENHIQNALSCEEKIDIKPKARLARHLLSFLESNTDKIEKVRHCSKLERVRQLLKDAVLRYHRDYNTTAKEGKRFGLGCALTKRRMNNVAELLSLINQHEVKNVETLLSVVSVYCRTNIETGFLGRSLLRDEVMSALEFSRHAITSNVLNT